MAAPTVTRPLTPREDEVFSLLMEGFTDGEIADRLGCSAYTVRAHIRTVRGKLGATSRVQAVAVYLRAK